MIDSNDGLFSYVFGHAKANHHPHYWAYFASLHSTLKNCKKFRIASKKHNNKKRQKCSKNAIQRCTILCSALGRNTVGKETDLKTPSRVSFTLANSTFERYNFCSSERSTSMPCPEYSSTSLWRNCTDQGFLIFARVFDV